MWVCSNVFYFKSYPKKSCPLIYRLLNRLTNHIKFSQRWIDEKTYNMWSNMQDLFDLKICETHEPTFTLSLVPNLWLDLT